MKVLIAILFALSFSVLIGSQNAYAGNGCTVIPNENDLILATGERGVVIKTVTCFDDVTEVDIDASLCASVGVMVRIGDFGINQGIWNGEEIIDHMLSEGTVASCEVEFIVTHQSGVDTPIQLLSVRVVNPTPVGGELIPIESTALLLANTQTFSWMIPVILSGIGIGLFVVSRKPENS